MKLKTLENVDIKGKTILYRAPYDIDVVEINGVLEPGDDMRIQATLLTLQYLLKENCKIVILTYVGRPDGVVVPALSTEPHARRLTKLLNHPVLQAEDCIGEKVEKQIASLQNGEILMLENVRFHKEEMSDDDIFAEKLCRGKDMVVFDGFPQAHRVHASTTGILRHLPAVAGFYMQNEVETLSHLLDNPKHPFTVIIGGAKISDKVDSVNNLLKMADTFLVGGAVANVFLKAKGRELGDSFVEDVFVDKMKREKKDWVENAKSILASAEAMGKTIICPQDSVISDGKTTRVITTEDIPAGFMALDIGPATCAEFSDVISKSKIVFINGPMGKFEDPQFTKGSEAVFSAMKRVKNESLGETIIAGGDTIDVARKFGSLDDYSHISLAGGATLEFLAGKELPALQMLLK